MKQTSQRSLLFRQNVNRTEAEWVHFLDGYRKALIEFDMKKFGDDWHTAEDIVEEIFLNIVREPRITALRPQDSFRHVLINMCMQKHKSFTKPWRKRLAERLSVALCLTMRTVRRHRPLHRARGGERGAAFRTGGHVRACDGAYGALPEETTRLL